MVMSVYESRIAEHPAAVDHGIRIVFLRSDVRNKSVPAEKIDVFINIILAVAGNDRAYVVY
jgi:hypothetical protein